MFESFGVVQANILKVDLGGTRENKEELKQSL